MGGGYKFPSVVLFRMKLENAALALVALYAIGKTGVGSLLGNVAGDVAGGAVKGAADVAAEVVLTPYRAGQEYRTAWEQNNVQDIVADINSGDVLAYFNDTLNAQISQGSWSTLLNPFSPNSPLFLAAEMAAGNPGAPASIQPVGPAVTGDNVFWYSPSFTYSGPPLPVETVLP